MWRSSRSRPLAPRNAAGPMGDAAGRAGIGSRRRPRWMKCAWPRSHRSSGPVATSGSRSHRESFSARARPTSRRSSCSVSACALTSAAGTSPSQTAAVVTTCATTFGSASARPQIQGETLPRPRRNPESVIHRQRSRPCQHAARGCGVGTGNPPSRRLNAEVERRAPAQGIASRSTTEPVLEVRIHLGLQTLVGPPVHTTGGLRFSGLPAQFRPHGWRLSG
jgi:hypothetical protein